MHMQLNTQGASVDTHKSNLREIPVDVLYRVGGPLAAPGATFRTTSTNLRNLIQTTA